MFTVIFKSMLCFTFLIAFDCFAALLARVFISDMTKARLEGLLDAFPKLIASDKCMFFALCLDERMNLHSCKNKEGCGKAVQ